MSVKCVIFDCDGVLVDTEKIGNQILINMAAEYGFKMELEEAYRIFNGRNLKSCFLHIENAIGQKLPADFEDLYRVNSFEAFKNEAKPVEGVEEFISKLKIPYCVASSGPVEKIRLNLGIAGLLDKFENKIFSSYTIQKWKPDPEIFLFAASEMGFQVNECIVIEDSIAGVMAGVKGGFEVYGFANEYNAFDLKQEGAILFSSFEELSDILNL